METGSGFSLAGSADFYACILQVYWKTPAFLRKWQTEKDKCYT